ncbi:hypothetical protein GCM10009676_19930 [Prauserella halophila]|uniref:Transposase n=1 Tax=Prauserella halophila TaxID=185641 RepID=A0ABN1W5B0_9PSEU
MPVAVSCRVLQLRRQHYYARLACPVTDTELDEAYLADALCDAAATAPSSVSTRTTPKGRRGDPARLTRIAGTRSLPSAC